MCETKRCPFCRKVRHFSKFFDKEHKNEYNCCYICRLDPNEKRPKINVKYIRNPEPLPRKEWDRIAKHNGWKDLVIEENGYFPALHYNQMKLSGSINESW